MRNRYPGSEPKGVYGFQYASHLQTELEQIPPEVVAQTDPSSLVDMIQRLPDSMEGWQSQQVDIRSEEEAQRINKECTLHIVDHATGHPIAGFARQFFQAVNHASKQDSLSIDEDLASTIAARTLNRQNSSHEGRLAAAEWVTEHIDADALVRTALRLSAAGRRRVLGSAEYNEDLRQAVIAAQAAEDARDRKIEQERVLSALERQVTQERRKRDIDAQFALEREAKQVLVAAPNADEFWSAYQTYKEYFPPVSDDPEAGIRHQSRLFEMWRFNQLQARTRDTANTILSEFRRDQPLNVPEGCKEIEYKTVPLASAVFPDAESLIAAMDDFYVPRNPDGVPLELFFLHSAEQNKQYVDRLLQAVREWIPTSSSHFQDPMHDQARGGLGDLLDYRGTALEDRDIEISRRADGSFALNQTDVGLYAGARFTFSDQASLEYHMVLPAARPDDEHIMFEASGRPAILRTIDAIPAEAIARHIIATLEPSASSDARQALQSAIVRPTGEYNYFRPSDTLEVGGAVVGMVLDYHAPHHRDYTPPDQSGAYTSIRTLVSYELPEERQSGPEVRLSYNQLSLGQAAVVWALAQQAKPHAGITIW